MNTKEYEEVLADAEKKLDRLRATYELYFQGMEKLEPTIQFKACERIFLILVREKPRSTNLRFRANQLIQKWSTYQMYWRRVGRQIEEGTYRRQVERARAKAAERQRREAAAAGEVAQAPTGKGEDGAWELDPNANIDLDMAEFEAEPPPKAPTQKEAPPAKVEPPNEVRAVPEPAATPATAKAPVPDVDETPSVSMTKDGYRPPAPKVFGAKKASQTGLPAVKAAAAAPKAPSPAAAKPAAIPPAPPAKAAPKPPAPPPKAPPAPPPAAGKVPPGRPVAPPPRPTGNTAQEGEIRKVYERYVEARRKNNEPIDNVKYEKVKQQIEKMLPDLQKKHAGKRIEFDVVLKDGKVGLKPSAK